VTNGYKLTSKCIDCGITFEWPLLPRQLLAEKMVKPGRCPSCRRAKRERVKKTGSPKARLR
jgi:Probable zinc-ribbon domain